MQPADIAAVGELAGRIWRRHYPDIISPAQIDYMLARMYSPAALGAQLAQGHQFRLLQEGDALLGFASTEATGPQRFFLHKFYIDQDRARCGLGTRLMQHLLGEYQPHEMQLHVNRSNIKAINFYFRHGFTIDGLVVTDIGNGYVMDDFRMIRKA